MSSVREAEAEADLEEEEEIEQQVVVESRGSARKNSMKKKEEEKLSVRLSSLVFLKATKLKKFSDCETWEPFRMTSFGETRALKILSKGDSGFQEMTDFNNKFLSRIYPKGSRFDSSNFDPILFWYAGCQIVALNYQTAGPPMFINMAKFAENGHAGYNLRRFDFIPTTFFGGARCAHFCFFF